MRVESSPERERGREREREGEREREREREKETETERESMFLASWRVGGRERGRGSSKLQEKWGRFRVCKDAEHLP